MDNFTNGKNDAATPPDGGHAQLFARYSGGKMDRFTKWLNSPHGNEVYELFAKFAREWLKGGHEKCGASLLGNRIRWEMAIDADFAGRKVPNDYLPMLARQLVVDDSAFTDFFNFHGTNAAQETPLAVSC